MSRDHLVLVLVLCVLIAGGLAGVVLWGDEEDMGLEADVDQNRIESPAETRRTNRQTSLVDDVDGVDEGASENLITAEGEPAEGAPPARPEDAALWGRVRDREGRAVAHAVVSLARDASPRAGRPQPGPDLALIETDAEGRYRLDALAPGDWLSVRVRHEAFAAKVIGNVVLVPGVSKHLDVTLLRGDALFGRVLSAEGDPLEGVVVRVAPQDAFMLLPGSAEEGQGQSDAEGRFRVDRLGQGYKRVWTESPGLETGVKVQVLIRRGEGAGPLEFRLGPAAAIAGRVVDDEGRPVEGALVNARPQRKARTPMKGPQGGYPGVQTDVFGRFKLEGLPAGAYTVSAHKTGFSTRGAFRHAKTGARDVEIVAKRNPSLIGRVVDAETGEPVTRFRLLASATPDLSIEAPQLEQHFDDAEGRFEFSLNRSSGQLWLIARARGYAGGRVGPIRVGATDAELVVSMERGVRVSGRVLGPEGRGAPGVRVQVEAARSEIEGRLAESVYAGLKTLRYHARTDAEGRWEVRGVMPGLYRLEAEKRGFAATRTLRAERIDAGRDHEFGELTLSRPGRIRGVVRESGRGTRPRTVVLRDIDGGRVRFRGSVSPDGSYVVEDIRPGSYRIEVHRLRMAAVAAGGASREVTIGAGEELVLDF